jgi:hypothetical protein
LAISHEGGTSHSIVWLATVVCLLGLAFLLLVRRRETARLLSVTAGEAAGRVIFFRRKSPEPVVLAPEPEPVVLAPEPEPVVLAPEPEPVVLAPEPEPVVLAPEPAIRLDLLGGLRVVGQDGREVPQPGSGRRTTREALAFLASHPGWVHRDTLVEALFGEDCGDRTPALHSSMSEARRWLITALTAGAALSQEDAKATGLLLIEQKPGQGYRLSLDRVCVDVQVFEDALRAARHDPESEPALRAAVEAYRGDLLEHADTKDGFGWVEKEGLRWRMQSDVALAAVRLAALLREKGRPEEALAMLDPLLTTANDDLWIQAMLAEGEPAPHGRGAPERVSQLWARYTTYAEDLGTPTDRAKQVYSRLTGGSG